MSAKACDLCGKRREAYITSMTIEGHLDSEDQFAPDFQIKINPRYGQYCRECTKKSMSKILGVVTGALDCKKSKYNSGWDHF